MAEILIRIVDPDGASDVLARRLLSDCHDIDGLGGARLPRSPAAAGERGIVEDVGALVVTVLNVGGAEALIALVQSVLPRQGNREVIATLPDGSEFALRGKGISDRQFEKATEALLALVTRDARDEKT